MNNVVPFKRSASKAKADRKRRSQGQSFCKRGRHKWQIDQQKKFDVQRGKLVTVHRCERCGASKTTLD